MADVSDIEDGVDMKLCDRALNLLKARAEGLASSAASGQQISLTARNLKNAMSSMMAHRCIASIRLASPASRAPVSIR